MPLGSQNLERSITGTSAAPGTGGREGVLAEVPLWCPDDWLQGSVKAGIGQGVGIHAFLSLFLLFFDILSKSGNDKFPCVTVPKQQNQRMFMEKFKRYGD